MDAAARMRVTSMVHPERVGGLAERLREAQLPVCPQLRPGCEGWYQVEGYCVSDSSPGWLMIPSIEIFRNYCTTGQFHQCPWFGGLRDGTGAVMPPRSRAPVRPGTWLSPDGRHVREI